ncbi:hypothetical protein UFOVP26_28 [uncultured Caudovirales phage]|uniref:Uncharacterized protein n=1 Tax=uncultured Caudovirales phage TaxID=2100421 RepID=A0A6J5KRI2_9CAUD|nr:hypothetical protein UFOVP26_28 [uncultured Caudovirales phage]CAB4123856.1 hypothetical protein UFOVP44_69 [uncultured Caudovirales phage]CAB5219293.1 hypothetical protein UFOVP220_60 [uncultured Caudovirales phage]
MWFPEVWQIIPIKNKNYLQSLWIGIFMPILWLPKAVFTCLIYPTLKSVIGGIWILVRTYTVLPMMGVTGYASGLDREFPSLPVVRELTLDELRELIKKMDEQEK